MLEARRRRCGYHIDEGKDALAVATFNWWRAGGNLVIQRRSYRVVATGFPVLSRYELRQGNTCVASLAIAWLPLPPCQTLTCGEQQYQIQNATVTHQGQVLGASRIESKTGRLGLTVKLDIPNRLPPMPKLLLAWTLLDRARSGE